MAKGDLASGSSPIVSALNVRVQKVVSEVGRVEYEGDKDPYKGLSPEDKQKGKQLAAAWIKMDKAAECKTILQQRSIYLVGLPAIGIEQIGSLIARRFENYRYLNMNDVIASASGQGEVESSKELISKMGEEAFREVEEAVLDQLQALLRSVISTDAGVVLRPSNWGKMNQGIVVYVEADIDKLAAQQSIWSKEELQDIQARCSEMFKQADVKVKIDVGNAADNIAVSIIESMTRELKRSKRGSGSASP
ncbi:hypothetical protein GUITHDRAFT_137405 [Guillardia theta CCMP2712]|uniref:Uncharacterized protein n=1 Tax=Guillardia theta (strain CCMP2712) TaxID=905079 RepID=L1JGL2_GUITC|nr:hypothetical protein GUITHDRAFT_137405 [Guillardia theta CCMP2712]EKX47641.1 hypothetical protein GUITHDRAFT_137405 [Guillardia theta CCMP2712]|eukprot:XP_005834621.1 hypothetical protein GUITHDRAFT_137405 [Guillardia theta CCMP2712]